MNTEIKICFKPVGERKYFKKIKVSEIFTSLEDADKYFDWGGEGNHIIENERYLSTYGILENWNIVSFESLKDKKLRLSEVRKKSKLQKEAIDEREKYINELKSKYTTDNGWIDPYGKFISLGFAQHNEWASDYLEEIYPDYSYCGWGKENLGEYLISCGKISKKYEYPYEYLEALGWFRLMNWSSNFRISPDYKKPNKDQLFTLYEICVAFNHKFNFDI